MMCRPCGHACASDPGIGIRVSGREQILPTGTSVNSYAIHIPADRFDVQRTPLEPIAGDVGCAAMSLVALAAPMVQMVAGGHAAMSSTPANTQPSVADADNALSGKYLTFRLGPEEFGVEILKVREIIGLMDITVVPRTPPSVRGVINLRGKIIPVVDLRARFDMEEIEDTELTCIIVVDVAISDRQSQMGILVDTVSEVLDIASDSIEPTPTFGGDVNMKFIRGMARVDEQVKILLNIEEVLEKRELLQLMRTNEASEDEAKADAA